MYQWYLFWSNKNFLIVFAYLISKGYYPTHLSNVPKNFYSKQNFTEIYFHIVRKKSRLLWPKMQ